MTLAAGSRLGPYEILAPLGAGGMGEVYRARDTRLGREVAVKVLPASFSQDADRLRRFEQEARAASALNHPNIVSLFDVGSHDGAPYVVSELLEGETLRSRLATGALSPRKATEYAIQIAQGLAAAHEKGIVHRDLKPENLFVTEDGRVKILDFGLAKLIQPEASAAQQTSIPTASLGTEPGVVMGTAGYMSPEQVKGVAADHRSDIFSFGAILYEMLSGRRAFRGDSAVETMSAILKEEPPDLSETNKNLSPGLERLVRHCLEKAPAQRFQSAKDLAYDLESLSTTSAPGVTLGARPSAGRWTRIAAAALAGALLFFAGRELRPRDQIREEVSYRGLTWQRGTIRAARFAPDGETIVYGAAWGGNPIQLFLTKADGSGSVPLSLPLSEILAVSPKGEMAISVGHVYSNSFMGSGTLARAPLLGGVSRPVLEGVRDADWAPDGSDLAVVRPVEGRERIEFPPGKVLFQASGYVSHLRFSPRGDLIAFLEHPTWGDDRGYVSLVDRSGKASRLTAEFPGVRGLAWSPDGREVWFSSAQSLGDYTVRAVDLSGRQRGVLAAPADLILFDVSPRGRALLAREEGSRTNVVSIAGESRRRDLSWFGGMEVCDFLPSNGAILLINAGESDFYSVYLGKTDGSMPVRLGEGEPWSLSADGAWAAALVYSQPHRLMLLPTGTGDPVQVPTAPLRLSSARWLPDGRRLVLAAARPDHGPQLFCVERSGGGEPRAFTPEGINVSRRMIPVSSDGRFAAGSSTKGRVTVYPIDGGAAIEVKGLEIGPQDRILGFSPEGRSLLVGSADRATYRIESVEIASGRRQPWKEIPLEDTSGNIGAAIFLGADGSYVLSQSRRLNSLYLVEGLK